MKLTALSIVKIIKVCKDNGVETLEIGDLKLSFRGPTIAQEIQDIPPSATIPRENPRDEERVRLVEQTKDADEDEAMLILNDPREFEERIANGDFGD